MGISMRFFSQHLLLVGSSQEVSRVRSCRIFRVSLATRDIQCHWQNRNTDLKNDSYAMLSLQRKSHLLLSHIIHTCSTTTFLKSQVSNLSRDMRKQNNYRITYASLPSLNEKHISAYFSPCRSFWYLAKAYIYHCSFQVASFIIWY